MKSAVAFLTLFLSLPCLGDTPRFINISEQQANDILRERAANSNWHSVTPPSGRGAVFGFELGAVAGATNTPSIDSVVNQASPGTNVKYLPHGGLLGVLSTPIPLTFEFLYFPKRSISGITYDEFGAAVKWNLTDNVLSALPVNLAVRGFMNKAGVSFAQQMTEPTTGLPVDATVNYDGDVKGLQVMVSPRFIPIIEPYAGVGFLSAKSRLNVTGTSGTFLGYTPSQSAEAPPSTTQIFAGLDVRLLFLGLGVEWSRAFGADTYNAKLSVGF